MSSTFTTVTVVQWSRRMFHNRQLWQQPKAPLGVWSNWLPKLWKHLVKKSIKSLFVLYALVCGMRWFSGRLWAHLHNKEPEKKPTIDELSRIPLHIPFFQLVQFGIIEAMHHIIYHTIWKTFCKGPDWLWRCNQPTRTTATSIRTTERLFSREYDQQRNGDKQEWERERQACSECCPQDQTASCETWTFTSRHRMSKIQHRAGLKIVWCKLHSSTSKTPWRHTHACLSSSSEALWSGKYLDVNFSARQVS